MAKESSKEQEQELEQEQEAGSREEALMHPYPCAVAVAFSLRGTFSFSPWTAEADTKRLLGGLSLVSLLPYIHMASLHPTVGRKNAEQERPISSLSTMRKEQIPHSHSIPPKRSKTPLRLSLFPTFPLSYAVVKKRNKKEAKAGHPSIRQRKQQETNKYIH